MVTRSIPYADPGIAAFEELDTYVQSNLIAGPHPQLQAAVPFPLANNASFERFSVVGIGANRKLAMATLGGALVAASGAITFTGAGSADETVVIGGVTYTLKAAPAAAYDVDIGADAAGTAANLAAAINAGAGAGSVYGTGTLPHPEVSASVNGAVVTVTARHAGAASNGVATTETSAAASFAAATLGGGVGVQAIGVLAHAASLGATGTGNGQVWYSGNLNVDALVWDDSFETQADKLAAFRGAPTPTNIIVASRG